MGVTFYTSEKIIAGSIIHLKVRVPQESNPVMVKGVLRWIEPAAEHFVGGIEWYHIDRGTRTVHRNKGNTYPLNDKKPLSMSETVSQCHCEGEKRRSNL